MKHIITLMLAASLSFNAGAKGSSNPSDESFNQSVVRASERVLMIPPERTAYAPDYRPMVCLPQYEQERRLASCKDDNGKNAWQYMSDVAPTGFKFSRFFLPHRYQVFVVFEPK